MFYQIFFNQCYTLKDIIDPTVIIDAGANIGLASIFFANQYSKAKIIAIEAEESNFNVLTENCSPYENILPLHHALWNTVAPYSIQDIGLGKSGFVVQESGSGTEKTITLTEIMKVYQLEKIDILKIDIEGSEKEVFKDASRWLPRTKCLIIELHDNLNPGSSMSVLKAVTNYNFDLIPQGENLVFINRDLD